MTITARIPELDLSDRCMIAMRRAGLGVSQAAEELRVSRSTISNWINGHITPRARDLEDFAELCDVDVDWLRSGALPGVMFATGYTPRDSNPEPTDYWPGARSQACADGDCGDCLGCACWCHVADTADELIALWNVHTPVSILV